MIHNKLFNQSSPGYLSTGAGCGGRGGVSEVRQVSVLSLSFEAVFHLLALNFQDTSHSLRLHSFSLHMLCSIRLLMRYNYNESPKMCGPPPKPFQFKVQTRESNVCTWAEIIFVLLFTVYIQIFKQPSQYNLFTFIYFRRSPSLSLCFSRQPCLLSPCFAAFIDFLMRCTPFRQCNVLSQYYYQYHSSYTVYREETALQYSAHLIGSILTVTLRSVGAFLQMVQTGELAFSLTEFDLIMHLAEVTTSDVHYNAVHAVKCLCCVLMITSSIH